MIETVTNNLSILADADGLDRLLLAARLHDRRLQTELELSPVELDLLRIASARELPTRDVANVLGVTNAAVTHAARRLEGRLLVERVQAPSRRGGRLALTHAGRQLLERAASGADPAPFEAAAALLIELSSARRPDPDRPIVAPTSPADVAALLVSGDQRGAELACRTFQGAPDDIASVWRLLTDAMGAIGATWASGDTSVAEEHVATATARAVAIALHARVPIPQPTRGRALVAALGHELGAIAVAQVMERDGWKVRYAGADVPVDDFVAMTQSFGPVLVALSVPRTTDVAACDALITELLALPKHSRPRRVIVGGSASAGVTVRPGVRLVTSLEELRSLR
ncbi:MAG: putative cobalamin binding protein [Thermoleophilia bacterium]|nr:putative cobalamin binding protein [Thermoleophilia bacterium]